MYPTNWKQADGYTLISGGMALKKFFACYLYLLPFWMENIAQYGRYYQQFILTYCTHVHICIILLNVRIMLWSKELVIELIKMPKPVPALWDIQSKEYQTRNLKSDETSKSIALQNKYGSSIKEN